MQLVLSWPVRVVVIGLLLFSLFVDGAGYIYRITTHQPLTGPAQGLPPHFLGECDQAGSGCWQLYVHRGLDLQGGSHLELQLIDIPTSRTKADIQAVAVSVFSKRLNSLGVSEPLVQPEGSDRVIVELAGISAAKAQEVIGKTAHLDFVKWVKDPNAPAGTNTSAGYKPQKTGLGSDQVTSASSSLDQNGLLYQVGLNFNSEGAALFGKLTTDAVNACPGGGADCPERHIAIFEDLTDADLANWDQAAPNLTVSPNIPGGKLLTNPVILNPITGGQAQITGNFTQQTAGELAVQINSGALPATVKVLQSTDVGASLGQDSVRKSLIAGGVGLFIVVLFMLAYYRLPGLLASLALLVYAAIVLAVFKIIPVTLTLAGLAGFILSIGMAVDANVLIFERFKEEMRAGRTVGAAVDAAIRRAWPAIRDSNFATLITCTVLAFAGTGPVKGFAITLGLGVLVSLVSSIIVTHNLLAVVLNFGPSLRSPRVLGVDRAA